MKILVLGATGFVGRNCVEYFLSLGHEVHAVRHNRPAYELEGVIWQWRDLCFEEDVMELFSGWYDVVIQAAAHTSGCKDTLEDPALHISGNAIMNSLIFRYARGKVGHVIFPSCSVMYQSSATPLKEDDLDFNVPLNPAYLGFASTKLYCEKLAEFYAGISDTKFTVMRNTNFYGQYDKYDPSHSHVFGATIAKAAKATDKITIWGTGNEARDFLHIVEFPIFVELAIENQREKFSLYNVGCGVAVTINDLAAKIIAASGKNLTIEHDLSAPTIPTSLCLDTIKAREELGWKPSVSLDDGIVQTLEWYRQNVERAAV